MPKNNQIKCRLCDYQVYLWTSKRNEKPQETGWDELSNHFMRAHDEEFEKILEYTGIDEEINEAYKGKFNG